MQHIGVAAVDDIHPLLVVHRKSVLVDHRFQVVQQVCTLFQQLRVTNRDGTQLFRREIRVAEHTLETVHIDVRDVTDHEDGLLHLTRVTDKVLDLAKPVVILFALLVNLHGLLKIVEHIARGGRCVNDILGGQDCRDRSRPIALSL